MIFRGILPLVLIGCSTSGPAADAGTDVCNHYIPSATIYDCEAGATSGCTTDPSGGAPSATHPVGCNATTTLPSGSDVNCNTIGLCNCRPLVCTCTILSGQDAGAQWICPN